MEKSGCFRVDKGIMRLDMELKDCIEKVLQEFEEGDVFDSHTIIHEIRKDKEMNEIYMHCFPENFSVSQYHGIIAQKIGEQKNIRKMDFKIRSHTIYGDLEPNQAWIKISK